MIIEPTYKYYNYIKYSHHYLNDPKHMLNMSINDLCRGYSHSESIENLKCFFNNTGHKFSISKIIKIILFHNSIDHNMIHVLCPNNGFPDKEFILNRNNEIDSYIKSQTEKYTRWMYGIPIYRPQISFPFKNYL